MGIESSVLSFDHVIDGLLVTHLLSSLGVVVDVFHGRPGVFLCGGTCQLAGLDFARSVLLWELDSSCYSCYFLLRDVFFS